MKSVSVKPRLSVYKPTGRSEAGKLRQQWYKSARWKAIRKEHLKNNPYCEDCFRESGGLVKSWIVDHIIGHQHANWQEQFWNVNALQTLCERHHNIKTKKERPNSGSAMGTRRRMSLGERKRILQRLKS